MPAFKDALTREQIWQIITYMRAGFPPLDETGRNQALRRTAGRVRTGARSRTVAA